jgi:hypothetical protein
MADEKAPVRSKHGLPTRKGKDHQTGAPELVDYSKAFLGGQLAVG